MEHTAPKKNPIIEAQHVSYRTEGKVVLEDLNFQIEAGAYVGLIGPNGGGKTTLLRLILGLIPLTEGNINLFGVSINQFRDQQKIGYVPQKSATAYNGFPASVEEIVRGARKSHIPFWHRQTREDREAVEKAMEITNILPLRHKRVSDLSGGEQQRVFIARALATKPEVLILDEPTTGVDIHSQEEFYRFLDQLHCDIGLTIVFVSHDVDVIAKEVESVLCLNRRLVSHSSAEDFFQSNALEELYGKKMKFIHHHDR